MAILKCKMCGGTLEYDRIHNLAVCPYCGSKSTVFEQDKKLFEQFQDMFASLLDQKTGVKNQEGFYVEETREELTREDGETIEIAYLTKRRADLCTVFVAKKHILFVFDKKMDYYAKRYVEMIETIKYPNQQMEEELHGYFPKLVTEATLADGSKLVVIEKKEGAYPLSMLGILLDRHVAWIISRLENVACVLSYNEMVLNALTIDNLFVDPVNHQIYVYGGWWFAGFRGAENTGASAQVRPYIEKTIHKKGRNREVTDLESIRMTAVSLLGYEDKESLKEDKLLPQPFLQFLLEEPKKNAIDDFAKWDKVLKASYGERKFIPLSMSQEEIYSKKE
ncbi:MAG TPA: hypothetical protein VJY54_02100 [Lachnospiraceae bacterium]|nr:hypothetical protein [Lachnospiraceae bacterium]